MALSNSKKQQIIRALGIRCPVRRWQQHRDGSVTVHTRGGSQTWKARSKAETPPVADPAVLRGAPRGKTRGSKSGNTEA